MNILKKLFHKHVYRTIAYNGKANYTKKCKICGYKQRIEIRNQTKYFTMDQIAQWAGDSNYFLAKKYD